ncbi:MAG: hypothetical protein J4G12_08130 [Gemmatimonadetes bacterium]|nr:hypothetical protein [Gemmatimonadota bacterium]
MSKMMKVGMAVASLATLAVIANYARGEAGETFEKVQQVLAGSSQECPFEATRAVWSDGSSLNVDAAAGTLTVVGVEGLSRIEVEAKACASREEWLDDLEVTLATSGGEVILETHYPDRRGGWRNIDKASLDVEVRVPTGLPVDVNDASGSIQVAGTGDLWIDDASGSIKAESILGSVRIEDSSGSLTVTSVEGDVDIEDGSGSITLSDVGGDVTVDDGSGSIRISGIGGSVLISEDGGGSIRVEDVAGDFVVEGDGGRGSIRHSDVRGEVRVPAKRRGGGV